MPFPFSASGKVNVRLINCDVESLIANVMVWLEREKAQDVQRDGSFIRFCAPSLFAGNFWNPIPFVDGSIEIASTAGQIANIALQASIFKGVGCVVADGLRIFRSAILFQQEHERL